MPGKSPTKLKAGATKPSSTPPASHRKKGSPSKSKKAKGAKDDVITENSTSPRAIEELDAHLYVDALDSTRTREASRLLREALTGAPAPAASALEPVLETPTTSEVVMAEPVVAEEPAPVELEAAAVESAPAPVVPTGEDTAQHAVAMCMALNRCMVPAITRVKAFNFSLDSLVGFDMQNAVVGVLGSGNDAARCATLFGAFGGKVLSACPPRLAAPSEDTGSAPAVAPSPSSSSNVSPVEVGELFATADVLVVHSATTLTSSGYLSADVLRCAKKGAMLLASSAGVCDLHAIANALEAGTLGSFGCLDLAPSGLDANLAARLAAMTNVIVPGLPMTSAPTAPPLVPEAADVTDATAAPVLEPVVAGNDGESAVRVAFFSSRSYFTERFAASVLEWNAKRAPAEGGGAPPPVRFEMHANRLDTSSAALAAGCKAVCLFVNDDGGADVLAALKDAGVELILMRCAGFDKIDLAKAEELGIKVARVPAYSPEAVAQQAVALLMTQTWQLAGTTNGLPRGIDLENTTVGVLGTGRIGYLFAMVMQGLGCKVIAYDPYKNKAIEAAGIPYMEADEVMQQADIISLHVPLLPATNHMINAERVAMMKKGVALLNVSRGALIDTAAVVAGLESGQIGSYGTDVYEHEAAYFFDDHSADTTRDELLSSLVRCPTAALTGHCAFMTNDALTQIVGTTMTNLGQYLAGEELKNAVKPSP